MGGGTGPSWPSSRRATTCFDGRGANLRCLSYAILLIRGDLIRLQCFAREHAAGLWMYGYWRFALTGPGGGGALLLSTFAGSGGVVVLGLLGLLNGGVLLVLMVEGVSPTPCGVNPRGNT